jgi:transcriptional regulator with XRE-family HTH domain
VRYKIKNDEELVSYKSLGRFVRQKRISMGYKSAERFAEANPGLTASYVKHIEAGDGMFGSPETFTGLAKALGVTPGLMMDILVDFKDFEGNLLQTNNTINLPDNFTDEDRKLISDLISFLGYRKQLNIRRPSPTPPDWLTPSYNAIGEQAQKDLEKEAEKKKIDLKKIEGENDQEETASP